jgi:hypothetical protein
MGLAQIPSLKFRLGLELGHGPSPAPDLTTHSSMTMPEMIPQNTPLVRKQSFIHKSKSFEKPTYGSTETTAIAVDYCGVFT